MHKLYRNSNAMFHFNRDKSALSMSGPLKTPLLHWNALSAMLTISLNTLGFATVKKIRVGSLPRSAKATKRSYSVPASTRLSWCRSPISTKPCTQKWIWQRSSLSSPRALSSFNSFWSQSIPSTDSSKGSLAPVDNRTSLMTPLSHTRDPNSFLHLLSLLITVVTQYTSVMYDFRVVSRQFYANLRSLPDSDKNFYCQNKIEEWEPQNSVELSVIDTFILCLNLSYWKNMSPQITRGFYLCFHFLFVPSLFPVWLEIIFIIILFL